MKVPFFSTLPLLGLLHSAMRSRALTPTKWVGLGRRPRREIRVSACINLHMRCQLNWCVRLCGASFQGWEGTRREEAAAVWSEVLVSYIHRLHRRVPSMHQLQSVLLMHTTCVCDCSLEEEEEDGMDRVPVWTECGVCRNDTQRRLRHQRAQ